MQSAPGIRRKLQVLEGLEGMNRFLNFWKLSRKFKSTKIQLKTDMKRNFSMQWSLPLRKCRREEIGEIDQEKGFRGFPLSDDGALSSEMLGVWQKYRQSTLLQCVDGILLVSTTEECGDTTACLVESLQALGSRVLAKKVQCRSVA